MKEKNKLWMYLMTLILAFGIVGTQAPLILAQESFHETYDNLDDEKKQKVNEILGGLKADLEKWGLKPPHHKHEFMANLDDKTKEQVKTIIQQLEEGKLTKEEADKKLAELGVDPKNDKNGCKVFENLDADKKKQAKEIFKQMKEGKISEEQAKEKLAEFGVEMPKDRLYETFTKLDEETKEKVKERVNEAKAEFEKIGVPFPKKYDKLTK
ncbi:hypothetical protein SAMN05880501_10499 [Ureibacillus xyleni]|uniref:Uncharacterized protein n=1 Tax=Ureibacillus xyleni TaxID=614648 RepID=A0A285SDI3_9BACL|nr:hypothetical protein [Ureibacillus xyleni]SOC05709.1 hypothetical protein SAMN05880501_10499 [Ureibacillus xyleni]